MHAQPECTGRLTFPADSKGTTRVSGTPSRDASSRARAGVTPLALPVTGSRWASMGFPKLMAARRVPVGARSHRTAGGGPASDGPLAHNFRVQRAAAISGLPNRLKMVVLFSPRPFFLSTACRHTQLCPCVVAWLS
jgi:hypothetical protein